MAGNQTLARILDEMAGMMEVLGTDPFRVKAYARAARAVSELGEDVGCLAKDRANLLAVPGIGPKMADLIAEFCNTGKVLYHEELRGKVPLGLIALMQVPGLGPKTLHTLWKEGGIEDAAALERAIADGSILRLPRMGEKSVEKLKAALAFAKTTTQGLWLGRAWDVADRFLERLRAHPAVERADAAGSLRRGKDTIGDIDIVAALKVGREGEGAAVGEFFRATPGVCETLGAGDTGSCVRVRLGHDTGRWKLDKTDGGEPGVQVDLRVLPPASWGAGLLYFTGSKDHNVRLRERARKMGMTLNEWGLFPAPGDGEDSPPRSRGVAPIASATEEEVYAALKLPWIPPEIREGGAELDLTQTPRLLEAADIRAELHAHTTASDGGLEIEELAREAKARGFHTIAVTDHSRSSVQANGLSIDRLMEHAENVRRVGASVKGITLLAGSEVDILADGSLDYPDKVLKALDLVVASPHSGLSQDPGTSTKRMIAAVRNPYVHILGHPTGRLINRRAGMSPDIAALAAAAREHGVALEINAHWMRLDLRDAHTRTAIGVGCLIAVDCDVHGVSDFDNLRYGVMTARRGWVAPARCINTWPRDQLLAWLKSKR